MCLRRHGRPSQAACRHPADVEPRSCAREERLAWRPAATPGRIPARGRRIEERRSLRAWRASWPRDPQARRHALGRGYTLATSHSTARSQTSSAPRGPRRRQSRRPLDDVHSARVRPRAARMALIASPSPTRPIPPGGASGHAGRRLRPRRATHSPWRADDYAGQILAAARYYACGPTREKRAWWPSVLLPRIVAPFDDSRGPQVAGKARAR